LHPPVLAEVANRIGPIYAKPPNRTNALTLDCPLLQGTWKLGGGQEIEPSAGAGTRIRAGGEIRTRRSAHRIPSQYIPLFEIRAGSGITPFPKPIWRSYDGLLAAQGLAQVHAYRARRAKAGATETA